jgi:hypothetical protein
VTYLGVCLSLRWLAVCFKDDKYKLNGERGYLIQGFFIIGKLGGFSQNNLLGVYLSLPFTAVHEGTNKHTLFSFFGYSCGVASASRKTSYSQGLETTGT